MYILTNISYRHPLLRKRVTALVKNDNNQELVRAGHSIRLNNEDFSLIEEKSTFNKHPETWKRAQIFLAEKIKSIKSVDPLPPLTENTKDEELVDDTPSIKLESVKPAPTSKGKSVATIEKDVNSCLTHKALDELYDKLGIEIKGFSRMRVADKKEAIISMLSNS